MANEKKMVVVIPSYKNAQWYERNLNSALSQNYSNYRIIYTDDLSPDNTGELVDGFLNKHNQKKRVQLIRNNERKGALRNLYEMIHSCDDDEIILTLDGDDWFPHSKVLTRVNQAYSDDKTWMTYGQYKDYPHGGKGCSRQIPPNIINGVQYRQFGWCSSHLRTFYAWLFKKIKKEDLINENGEFYAMAWDLFIMFPMLEMSGHHATYIPDVLYSYNTTNPINDHKVNHRLQVNLERLARSKPKYKPL